MATPDLDRQILETSQMFRRQVESLIAGGVDPRAIGPSLIGTALELMEIQGMTPMQISNQFTIWLDFARDRAFAGKKTL